MLWMYLMLLIVYLKTIKMASLLHLFYTSLKINKVDGY